MCSSCARFLVYYDSTDQQKPGKGFKSLLFLLKNVFIFYYLCRVLLIEPSFACFTQSSWKPILTLFGVLIAIGKLMMAIYAYCKYNSTREIATKLIRYEVFLLVNLVLSFLHA